jgi:hypothetical protein
MRGLDLLRSEIADVHRRLQPSGRLSLLKTLRKSRAAICDTDLPQTI